LVIPNHLHREVLRRPIDSAEYTAELFASACSTLAITQSMGRAGSCFDCEHHPPAWWVSATTLPGGQRAAA
jgi:hypothetical protein